MTFSLKLRIINTNYCNAIYGRLLAVTTFLFIAVIFTPSATALNIRLQEPRFDSINTKDGLSQSGVVDIIQDDRGFMWFATQYGLNRYDGRKIEHFYANPNNTNTLASNSISRLDKDSQGHIWVLTSSGLDSIHPQTLEITNWVNFILEFLIQENIEAKNTKISITDFRFDQHNNLYLVVNYRDLLKINLKSKQVQNIQTVFQHFKTKSITGILILDNSRILINSGNCFYFFDTTRKFELIKKDCSAMGLDYELFQTHSLQGDELFIGINSGFLRYNTSSYEKEIISVFDSKSQANSSPISINVTEQGYWLGTPSGLKFWDKTTKSIIKEYYHDSSDPFSIVNNDILKLMRSDDGVLWIGTSFGISLLKPKQEFSHLLKQKETKSFDLANLATTVTEDSNRNLWVGTSSSGVYKYSANNGVLENSLKLEKKENAEFTGFVSKILEDNNQNLWVLAESGLSVKPLDSKKFKTLRHFKHNNKAYDFGYGFDLVQDRYSNFWLGGSEGLLKLEVPYELDGTAKLNQLKLIDYTKQLPKNFLTGDYGIYTIFEDLQGFIWLGGSDGLVRFNPNNLKTDYYRYDPKDATSLSSSDISTIYEDYNGVLWIGTNHGLNRVYYNDNGKIRFKRIGVNDGFHSDYISSIQDDDQGFLWISTIKGITRYHPSNLEPVVNYLYEQGLQHDEFYTKSSYKDQDGILYFGGVNGINYFDPENITIELKIRPLKISLVSQNNINYDLAEGQQQLELKQQAPIKIRVSNFDYVSNRHMELRYRFSPDMKWQKLVDTEVILHQLDEEIELQVQQKSIGGDWIEPGVYLKIIPKFTVLNKDFLWALSVFGILFTVMLSVYWFYRKLSRKLYIKELMYKREKAKQSMLMEEKLTLLHQVEDLHYSLSEQKYLVDKIENELVQKEIKDELTGLYSRGYIRKNIQYELDSILASWKQVEHKGLYLGLFSVEIDNFPSLKEQFGYIASNEVLNQVATALSNICYGTDILVRWEGAKILILSRGISKREQMVLAEKIRNIIASSKFNLSNGKKIDITASIGFTRYPFIEQGSVEKQPNWSKLLYIFEMALSTAQSNSLNAWIGIFSNQFTDYTALEEALLKELPTLINSGQLDYVSSIPKAKKLQWE